MNTNNLVVVGSYATIVLVGSLCGLFWTAVPANASVALTIGDTNGAPNVVNVDLGTPASLVFDITVGFIATEATTGITFLLDTPVAGGGSGKFLITARDATGIPYDVLSTTNASLFDPTIPSGRTLPNAGLEHSNIGDLGATLSDPFIPVPAGPYSLGLYTVEVLDSIAPGTYVIQTVFQSATGAGPNFDEISAHAATYTVHVVPEPAVALQLCLGCVFLAGWRRRRE